MVTATSPSTPSLLDRFCRGLDLPSAAARLGRTGRRVCMGLSQPQMLGVALALTRWWVARNQSVTPPPKASRAGQTPEVNPFRSAFGASPPGGHRQRPGKAGSAAVATLGPVRTTGVVRATRGSR